MLTFAGIPTDIKVGIVSASLIVLLWLRKRKSARLPLPPGPKKRPIVGNLFDLPTEFEWVKYHEWCQEFDTDILHLQVAGQNIIVLDTPEATNELLERRSSLYSGRPRMPMINELMGWNFNFGFQPYGDHWRKHRRLFHMSFHPTAALRFRPHELKAAHGLLRRLIEYPNTFSKQLQHMASETIILIAYGLNVKEKDDPFVNNAEKAAHTLVEAALPGQYLVDTLPILKYVPSWFPGAGFKRKAKEWKKLALKMVNDPFKVAKEYIEQGDETPSFVFDALRNLSPGPDRDSEEWIIASTAGTMFTAASDTTTSTITSCILGLLEHPEILKKAQREIDDVVGKGQLPTFEHYDKLPYITALAKEALRWRDAVPVAVPHMCEVEDHYKGYRIPAGSIVLPNAWAMLHNPEVYPDPFEFNPERFLRDGQLDPTVRDPAHAAFGFGRRICPGRYMAFSAMWITIASMVAAFDIEKARDKNGNIIELSHAYKSGLVINPLPFDCSIKPRSKEMEDVIYATKHEVY